MNIAVLIKSVPRSSDLNLNPDFTIPRSGQRMEVNKSDLYAIEEALRIRKKTGGIIRVISMGSKSSINGLRYALSMGADEAFLISDDAFRGSDSYATSLVLSTAIRKTGADLVICGKRSSDGSTAQVPSETAAMLGYDLSVNTVRCDVAENGIICTEKSEYSEIIRKLGFPALIAVENGINTPRLPDINCIIKSREKEINILGAAELGISPGECGINGSLTRVVSTERISAVITREGKSIGSTDEIRASLISEISSAVNDNEDITVSDKKLYDLSALSGNRVMVICECRNGRICEESLYVIRKALPIADKLKTGITAVIPRCDDHTVKEILAPLGVGKVYRIDAEDLLTSDINSAAELILKAAETEDIRTMLLPSTVLGMRLAPYIAAKSHSGLTADCIELWVDEDKLYQKRPAFSGKVNAVIISQNSAYEMATVKPFACETEPYEVRHAEIDIKDQGSCETVCESSPSEMVALDQQIIVGIGAGVTDKDELELIKEWCCKNKYGLAATRRAVDTGMMPVDHQVGLTGRMISPKLYIAIGISGALEHIVGVTNAGRVISVNPSRSESLSRISDVIYNINSKEFIDIIRKV